MIKISQKFGQLMIIICGIFLFFILWLASRTTGCDKVIVDRVMETVSAVAPPPPPPPPPPIVKALSNMLISEVSAAELVQEYDRKLVRKGNAVFEVKNITIAHDSIVKAVTSLGGYIANEQESNNEYRHNFTMQIRIISLKYDLCFSRVLSYASHLDSRSSNVEDVTDQFIDTDTRLRNKKNVEESISKLLKSATKMEDILNIQSKLGDIRAEIEALQGKLNVLQKDIAFSTIDISFYKTIQERQIERHSFWSRFTDSFITGWSNFLSFFTGLMTLWPFILLICLLVYFGLRYNKARFNRKNKE